MSNCLSLYSSAAITEDTHVSFPSSATVGESTIIGIAKHSYDDNPTGILIAKETPFHPLDHTWPDQPGDTGDIIFSTFGLPVVNTITGAINPASNTLHADRDIPARREDSNWIFVVLHVVEPPRELDLVSLMGERASFRVDRHGRHLLSASHTACHLMALALNGTTRHLWRKEVRQDSLGSPDLDQLAIVSSRMSTLESKDHYRFGKSLRKSGFDSVRFFEELDQLGTHIESQLAEWLETGAPVHIEAPDSRVSSRRFWTCDLPEGQGRFPCGGTHLASLNELQDIRIMAEKLGEEPEVMVTTVPTLRVPDVSA